MAPFTISSQITTRIILFLVGLQFAAARPVDLAELFFARDLVGRERASINNETGTARVFTPEGDRVLQGPATDGAGFGFDAPAVIWLVFCAVIGLPLAFGGIRGWRLTTGTGIGLAAAVSSYAAFINTVDEVGVSDLILTLIVMAFFVLGFIFGLFEIARLGGMTMICISGGIALGMRIVLPFDGLLFSESNHYVLNWIPVAVLGAAMGLLMIWRQRLALLLGCTSSGTFLSAIALDVVLHRQTGLSRGLRYLMDRNPSHFVDLFETGYNPNLTTRIIIWVSIGLIPVLAFAQHKIFKQPFSRLPEEDDSELQINYDEKYTAPLPSQHPQPGFFGNLWDHTKAHSANRFSLDSRLTSGMMGRRPGR